MKCSQLVLLRRLVGVGSVSTFQGSGDNRTVRTSYRSLSIIFFLSVPRNTLMRKKIKKKNEERKYAIREAERMKGRKGRMAGGRKNRIRVRRVSAISVTHSASK